MRGMNYQAYPYHEDANLIRCMISAIHDVIIDLRSESDTYMAWNGAEFSADNRQQLGTPKGFAHRFLTPQDCMELFYQMRQFWAQESGRRVRWNDPVFAIDWPTDVVVLSERDKSYPGFERSWEVDLEAS